MYFPVLPTVYRKMSVFFCTITSITSLLVTILMFLVLYLGNQVQGIVFISFLFSVILSIVAWRACLITIKCNEYVHIIVDKRIVALYSPTGKALRTFNFSDIVDVRVVNLPQVMYAASIPYVRKQQYICIQSDSSHAETRPHTTYSEIRSNPHCIVLAYNEYAYPPQYPMCVNSNTSVYNLILHTPKHVPIQPIQRFEVIPTALF